MKGQVQRRFALLRLRQSVSYKCLIRPLVLSFYVAPPGNRLEQLGGDRKGQYSVRINQQYRLCFRFEDGNAFDAQIVDYH
ncbi:MAG: proteic killer suppression protein [Alteromonadaceae bacterium]|jgi:proteic killer suppression protein